MAIDFTDNPSNGDTVTAGGRTYTYESSSAKWKITSTTALNPTLTATASGTLANGDMVIVNSDGSVSAVTQTAASAGVGSESIFESASTNATAATFDSNANKVVVVYKDIGNSGYGTAVVGTVSGTSIAFGTPVVFNSGEVSYPRAVFNSTTNKIVVSYRAHNITNRPHAIVGTVSGTGITFGTASALDSVSTNFVDCASIPNTSKVIFAISVGTSKGMTVVGTISGTSITIGSEDTFLSGYCVRPVVVWDSNSNKAVIAFRDHNNSGYAKAVVATVSGTDTTFGSLSTFHADSTYSSSIGFDSNLNKVVIAYRDNTTDYGEVVVGTVSGTSITFGTSVVFSTGRPFDMWPTFDSNTNKIVLAYYEANNSYQGQIRVGTVSGTSISFDSAISFGTNKILNIGSVFDSTSNKTIITFENDIDNTEYGTAVVFSTASNTTNLTASNYIGVSDAAYSDSATATIQLMGAVDDAQSGLTPGQSYYIQNDGTLSTSAGTPSVLAGTAISATKLIVKGEIAAAAAAGLLVSSSGGGVTTYANIAALPSSGNTAGDLAFVTDVKAFYGWDGTEWDRIFSGQNMLPEFTTSPAASYNLASDGTATTVTVAATDPEGFAITYSHDTTPANQAQATITQSGGTFTVTPSTTSSNAGTFTARFKAFDGVRTNSVSSTFELDFQQFFAPQSLSSASLINSGGNSLGPNLARGFGVDPSNRIYYTDLLASTLYQWDISNIISEETASPSGGVNSKNTVSIPGTKTHAYYRGVCITPDGNYVFISDNGGGSAIIRRYELTTAFDISTIQSPSTDTFSASITGDINNISISEDGTIIYMGTEANRIHKLVMTTALDLSTASIVQTTSANGNHLQAVDPTGTRVLDVIYTASGNSTFADRLLSTAHDLSTIGSRSNVTTLPTSQMIMGAWTADGNYALIGSQSTDRVYIYKLT